MMKDDCNSYVSEAISVKKRPSIENRKSAMVVMKKVYHEEIAIRRQSSGKKPQRKFQQGHTRSVAPANNHIECLSHKKNVLVDFSQK